jgi:hypothetical protein
MPTCIILIFHIHESSKLVWEATTHEENSSLPHGESFEQLWQRNPSFPSMRSIALLILGASMHASPGCYNQLPDCAHSCPEGVMNTLQHTILQLIYQLISHYANRVTMST